VETNLFAGGLGAFAIASFFLWVLAPVARRIGLVDHPGGRKTHYEPTPLVGGIAMYIAFAFSVLVFHVPVSIYRLLFAGTLILVVVGVLDDLHELSTKHRFGAQIVASLLMTVGAGVVLNDLGYLMAPDKLFSLGLLSIPLSVFATVGVINAVNMSDGIDGLAGSLVLIAVSALCVIAWVGGQPQTTAILVMLVGVLLAFLIFNLRLNGRALVFMGDAGSMLLGFVLAWFLVELSQGEDRLLAPVTALWIIALPLIDTVSMMLRRIRLGRSPFLADREHLHDILMAAGFSAKQTLMLMVLVAMITAGIGLAGHLMGVAEHGMFLGFLALFTLHHWAVMKAWRVKRFLKRPLVHPALSKP
jgi:UDP-GlcNAc:undecaprenyl-phosphate GlcNAc-1-phosphate transferase